MDDQMVAENEVVLVDLSSIAYPIWHTSQSNPDPNYTSQQVVARVRALASGKPMVAICCDSGRSFRKDIAATYKANRPEQDGTLKHQIALACEQLSGDGFPVWSMLGFEADDLIASATARALATPELSVLVVTADKDLLQLVGPRVRVLNATSGSVFDAEAVGVKLGVTPEQVRDYLTLVGDTSDNIAGAKGIGPKKAADLLAKFSSIDSLYEQLEAKGASAIGIQPAIAQSLHAFKAGGGLKTARELVTLRTDADVPFAQLGEERTPKESVADSFAMADNDLGDDDPAGDEPLPPMRAASASGADLPKVDAAPAVSDQQPQTTAMATRSDAPVVTPVEWQLELGPRSLREARTLAQDMFQSRLFSAYGTPQGVLSTVMLGRELGIPAMASLRGIHIIEGRHALSAQLMVALVIRSGLAEYFEPDEISETRAVFVTKRRGARKEIRLEHTIEMARTAGLIKPDSNWVKVPTDMCVARCQARLCRLVYSDIVMGLYTPDELLELRQVAA